MRNWYHIQVRRDDDAGEPAGHKFRADDVEEQL
jgi:hypothetical protein